LAYALHFRDRVGLACIGCLHGGGGGWRFLETARELGVDDQKSAEEFERTFEKIVPLHRITPSSEY
jgi:hypothetical protein